MRAARISKIAGLGLAGMVVASIAADKVNVGPVASQLAGFAGAFIGTVLGRRGMLRKTRTTAAEKEQDPAAER